MSAEPPERCSDVSRAAGEPLAATASTTERWVLIEVPGSWPRDVTDEGALPERAQAAVAAWLSDAPRSRLLFLRRPGRSPKEPTVLTVRSDETLAEVRRIAVERYQDLADADLDASGDIVRGRLVLVCGHGSRDRCCALRGTAVFGALAEALGEEELWISSHQGGHRFAGNALVLPAGVQLGRLDPDNAPSVVQSALDGRIELGNYRGRTFYEPRVQAAEHAIREAERLYGVDDLRLVAVEDGLVRFRVAGLHERAAAVEEAAGPAVPASCGAQPEPQTVFTARVV